MRTDSTALHKRLRLGAAVRVGLWCVISLCLVLLLPDTITWPVSLPGPGTSTNTVPIPVRDLLGIAATLTTYPIVWAFFINHLHVWLEFKQLGLIQRFLTAKADSLAPSQKAAEAGVTELNHLSADLVIINRNVRNMLAALWVTGIVCLVAGGSAIAGFLYQLHVTVHAEFGLIWSAFIVIEIGLVLLRIARRVGGDFPQMDPPQPDIDQAIARASEARSLMAYANGTIGNWVMPKGQ